MRHRGLVCILVLLVAAACSQEQPGAGGAGTAPADTAAVTTDTSDTATATHPASPGGTALIPSTASGTTVVVLLEDGRIVVETTSIPPGQAVFTVTNGSPTNVHNLHVEGPGVSRAAGDPLPEKTVRSFEVPLQAGTYTLYCPVLNHRDNGETATITVGQ